MFGLAVSTFNYTIREMHIPDGYLSPLTTAAMLLLMVPFWAAGARVLRRKMNARNVPLVALFAAFSFVVMMFNVPLPGGTTGHAVAGALAAIILGPEIAVIAISIALAIQALFFGDGGLLAFGANCFNMAVILPYVSYGVYRLVSGDSAVTDGRRVWGAALGAYLGLTVAALFAAVEFGIQPALFHTAAGAPLYAPYPLSISIPAMVLPHMLVASVIEAVLTALVVVYLQRTNPALLRTTAGPSPAFEEHDFRRTRVLWVVLVVLVLATPLGLLAPGTAWGEWSAAELSAMGLGRVPDGLAQLRGLWGAPIPNYRLALLGNADLAYVLSAVMGVALVALVVWLLTLALGVRATSQPNEAE
jgi:cobalt/nickel transport system permease protein